MSTPVLYGGVTYNIPSFGDTGYAQGAGNLSLYLVALATGSLTTSGGTFSLLGDVNFGTNFGLIAKYFISSSANPATSGVIRLENTDSVEWRNFANSGNDVLAVNASDQLTYNGTPIQTGAVVTSITGTANEIIASSATGAVTLSTPQAIAPTSTVTFGNVIDNGLTPSTAVATNGSDQLVSSSTTATELGFVHGVTSSIQTQINGITSANPTGAIVMYGGAAAPSGWLLCDGTSYTTAGQPNLFAVIGYTFGGAGPNFNVPSMANNVPIGPGSIAALGVAAGAQTVTAIQNPHTHSDSGHQHTTASGSGGGVLYNGNPGTWPSGQANITSDVAQVGASLAGSALRAFDNTTTNSAVITSTTATNQAASVIQPVLGLTFIIKT